MCRNFMSDTWRLKESFLAIVFAIFLVVWGYMNLTFPKINKHSYHHHQCGKMFLLVFFSIAFGIELGFKFATQTVIYLLNPCHVMTLMQVCFTESYINNYMTKYINKSCFAVSSVEVTEMFNKSLPDNLCFSYICYLWLQAIKLQHYFACILPFLMGLFLHFSFQKLQTEG